MARHTNVRQREVRPLLRSIPDTAEMLSVSRRLVVELVRAQEIQSLKIRGRRMVPESAIITYIENGVKLAMT